MRLKKVVILIVVLIIQTSYTFANTSISIGYQAKYRNFDNFDYVNSEAIKGGGIVISAFGCITFSSCFLIDFNAIVNLITFIPPPAEPAHAPMKLDKKTMVIIKVGQLL